MPVYKSKDLHDRNEQKVSEENWHLGKNTSQKVKSLGKKNNRKKFVCKNYE